MKKRILSLIASIVLILVAVIGLQNEKVVEAADDLVLLEKRHPGYWEWLSSENSIEQNIDRNYSNEVSIFPINKNNLKKISYSDFNYFFKDMERDNNRRVIDFLDGTGINMNTMTYGKLDRNEWIISDPMDSLINNGKFLLLEDSSGTSILGINGIEYTDIDFSSIDSIYLYLAALNTPDYSFVISAMDDASLSWNWIITKYLSRIGLKMTPNYRDSYIAVKENGELIYEQVGHELLEYSNKNISVTSAGLEAGNYSSIQINGKEYSKQSRGLNIVVFRDGSVIDSVNFDTWDKLLPCKR